MLLAATVWLAGAGLPIGPCLVIVAVAPTLIVIGYELYGHRRTATVLTRRLAR